ncbi:MAG: pilus assembly PilX N-terminal domain-containing protein [Desulfobacterales bacterium]
MKKILRIKNENGSVVVLALIMVVLLSLLGMAVSRTSSIDVQVASNGSRALQDLYQAESGDHYALETWSDWMTDTFLSQSFTTANAAWDVDMDGDTNDDNRLEIRCIELTGNDISTLSDGANHLPRLRHIGPPPFDSKSSLSQFVIRRYGITSTSLASNTQVQIGAYKLFNNFNQ